MKAKRTKLVLLAILVLALAALVITCPGRKAHREALIDSIVDELATKANLNPLGDVVKSLKLSNYDFYNSAINPCLKVKGYGLFSIGYIESGEHRERVSFGILRHVFIKGKENITHKTPMLAEPMPVPPQKEEPV